MNNSGRHENHFINRKTAFIETNKNKRIQKGPTQKSQAKSEKNKNIQREKRKRKQQEPTSILNIYHFLAFGKDQPRTNLFIQT